MEQEIVEIHHIYPISFVKHLEILNTRNIRLFEYSTI